MIKPRVVYAPDTDSLGIFLSDHPGTEAEEVAENFIVTYDDDNNIVGIEIVSGASEIFADLLAKAGKHAKATAEKAS